MQSMMMREYTSFFAIVIETSAYLRASGECKSLGAANSGGTHLYAVMAIDKIKSNKNVHEISLQELDDEKTGVCT
jgi:hypothetical protein